LATKSHGCLPFVAAKLRIGMLWPEFLQELLQEAAVALQRDVEIHVTSSTEAVALASRGVLGSQPPRWYQSTSWWWMLSFPQGIAFLL